MTDDCSEDCGCADENKTRENAESRPSRRSGGEKVNRSARGTEPTRGPNAAGESDAIDGPNAMRSLVADSGFERPPSAEDYRMAFLQLAGALRGMDEQAAGEAGIYGTGDKAIRARSRTLSAVRDLVDVYDPETDDEFGDTNE